MNLKSTLLCVCLAACTIAVWAQTEKRVALVIGNSAYAKLTPLKNPVNDARDTATALGRLGFQVRLLTNAGLPQMDEALLDFAHSLSGDAAATGVFYYAGHGVQQGGVNYLIPADADIQVESQIKYRSLSLSMVMDSLAEARNRLNLIILDACRDNPFGNFRTAARGLAVVGQQPTGSVVVYATTAGQTASDGEGRNGVFTGALLKYLEQPLEMNDLLNAVGREVQTVTRGSQSPAVYRQFFDTYYLVGKGAARTPAAASATGGSTSGAPAGAVASGTGAAMLVISTDPDGAEVFIDGKLVGSSPYLAKDLPAGAPVRIEARKGNSSASREVTLKPKETADVSLLLEVEKGNLFIRSTEKAVDVWVDGVKQGALGSGLVKGIPTGERSVELKGEGLYWNGKATVAKDDTVQVEAGPAVVGRISYDIPQGVSARVEGKGFDRTLSGRGTVENMPAGSYTAIASGSGYVEERTTIQIARGQETLYIAYRAGTLEITGTPAGADVYVDGMHRGALPLTLRDIVKGSHSIEVKEDGYEDAREAAAVQGGFGAKVSVALKKKPQVTQPEGFVMVDGGTFRMGDTFGAGNADEKPVHTVTVSSFFLSTYEVTFDQYDRFCDETGRSKPGDNRWGRGSRPAINVRWFDAAEYCNWLSRKEGLTSFYTISGTSAGMNWSANGYRLPTEAEWEYAAKGGKQSKGTRYSGGDSPDAVAWNWGNSGRKTQPVGGKQANELGLYDMSGNVWEWCNDLYGERYYASSPSTDPRGSDSGQYRVLRGGSWADNSDYLRASARIRIRPDLTLNHLGFRPARPFVQGR